MGQASKESIENLVKNASLAVGDMYPIIKQDMRLWRNVAMAYRLF